MGIMNFGKILGALLALLFGIGADWFVIVWGINNDIAPMYIIIALLILTGASIGVIIWDLKS